MPRIQDLQPAFNAGELSPRLASRLDFVKYRAGLELCVNLIPLPEGGVTRRPATRFVAEVANSAIMGRLQKFEFNVEQAYILELGSRLMRFYRHQAQITAANTNALITNGTFDTNITGWTDQSTGSGLIVWDSGGGGRLELDPGGSDIAIAEQSITISASLVGIEHVLKFKVEGDHGDRINLRIGTSSGGMQLFTRQARPGFHSISFIPTTTTFFLQFRKGNAPSRVAYIDDVSFIDDSAVEVGTPWAEDKLFVVNGPQSADVLYLFHEDNRTFKLIRRSHVDWSLERVDWLDGPYLDENVTSTTLTPSGTSDIVTVTASSTDGINDNRGFLSTDLDRMVRIKNDSAPPSGSPLTWGWGIIVGVTSDTVVDVQVKKAWVGDQATTTWRLGAWSGTTGWPQTGVFFEQRLYVAATSFQPQNFWASQTADYENMTPDDFEDTIEDDDALTYELAANDVNAIKWMSAGEDVLVLGTAGGQWVPKSSGVVLTPNDLVARRQTTDRTADLQPVRVNNVVLFIQRALRKVMEFGFAFEVEGYKSQDMTRLAQHVTRSGLKGMAFAQEPDSVVWANRTDGTLLSMTYRRDEDVVGWARHALGGNGAVESIEVIPGADGGGQVRSSADRDEVWLLVRRNIDGQTKRYIEVMEGYYDDADDQEDAYYADSLITYDGVLTTTIAGLDHLEGETVKIWADGSVRPDKVVSSGQITLDLAASVAQIGLGYTHRGKTLKVSAGNPAGTPVGKRKRVTALTFVLLNCHTLKYGEADGTLIERDFRQVEDETDTAVPLFTGELIVPFPGDWRDDARIVFESDAPAPFTLLAIAPDIELNPLT